MEYFEKMAFCERLKQLRKGGSLTQSALAEALGIDRSTYAYYETGKTSPDLDTLCRMAAMFQMSVDELLGKEVPIVTMFRDNPFRLKEEEEYQFAYLTREEQILILQYRQLASQDKRAINEQVRKHLEDTEDDQ